MRLATASEDLFMISIITFYNREKDQSISVEDLLYDIFKDKEADHLLVGDFLSVSLQHSILLDYCSAKSLVSIIFGD